MGALLQDFVAAAEVDVSGREVVQALVVAAMVVVIDKGVDLLSEITRQIVVLQQDTVLEGLMPSLDLTLRLRVIWSAADMVHLLIFEPIGQLTRDIARPIV